MDDTLQYFLRFNAAWASAIAGFDPSFFPTSASEDQRPRILWIGCSDSRVPDGVVTNSRPGEVFTHRNIANQVCLDDDSVVSAIEFAVYSLQVNHIFIVGHSNCGAIQAALERLPDVEPRPDSALERWLAPLVELARSVEPSLPSRPEEAVAMLVEENVKAQLTNVVKSPPIQQAWESPNRNVWIHGLVYDLATGRLRDLDISQGRKGLRRM